MKADGGSDHPFHWCRHSVRGILSYTGFALVADLSRDGSMEA